MPRTLKQILYGFGFLVVLGIVSVAFYKLFLVPAPSCFDNVKNGKEEAIDCGAGCIPCELKTLKLITSPVEIKAVGKKTTLVLKITNPSSNYGLKAFDYSFEVDGAFGAKLATFERKSSIAVNESKYLIVPGIDIDSKEIGKVSFNLSNSNWEKKEVLPVYQIGISKIQTALSADGVEVSGSVKNSSSLSLKSVKLVAIIFDKAGGILNASETELNELGAFSESPFTIFFPKVLTSDDLDTTKTHVFTEVSQGVK